MTARCPTDAGESLLDYRHFHYCTMDGWPALSIAALVAVVVLAFYVLGRGFICGIRWVHDHPPVYYTGGHGEV